jgi:hypothetical protein
MNRTEARRELGRLIFRGMSGLSPLLPVPPGSAFGDQVAAAAQHTEAAAGYLAAHADLLSGVIDAQTAPEWLRLSLADTLAAHLTGSARTCLHSPSPLSPQPIVAAAWRPDMITCRQCSHLLTIPPGSERDRTCDHCGIVGPPAPAREVYAHVITAGPLAYLYGLCPSCNAEHLDAIGQT